MPEANKHLGCKSRIERLLSKRSIRDWTLANSDNDWESWKLPMESQMPGSLRLINTWAVNQ